MRAELDLSPPDSAWELPTRIGFVSELDRLAAIINAWVESCDSEVRRIVSCQMTGPAKHFRPITVLACHYASTTENAPELLLRSAAAVEVLHNVTLIVDDMIDRSRVRRGAASLHCRFGSLRALMVAGYMGSGAVKLIADDSFSVRLLAEITQRLSVAECLQWRLRRRPLGVEDWRMLAGEDTGSMFEVCASLGTRDDRLRRFGHLLGILYHGCDDVADIRGTAALGGGCEEDVAEGILTLPAAIAIRNPRTALLFRRANRATSNELLARFVETLPEAEGVLDRIQAEAEAEAVRSARYPYRLLELVHNTRLLSNA